MLAWRKKETEKNRRLHEAIEAALAAKHGEETEAGKPETEDGEPEAD